jgi:hypothetical protein
VTGYTFPVLGFDPAPGAADALSGVGRECAGFALALDDDAVRVQDLAHGSVWSGPAADAFRHRLEDLPRDLRRAGDAYREAGAALVGFASALQLCQLQARCLEAQAAEHARVVARFSGGEDPRLTAAVEELNRARVRAQRLREQVRTEAARCSRALQDATRQAPHAPGWFHQLVDAGVHAVQQANQAVGDFVREHAAAIAQFADVLGKVSSALSLVAMLAAPFPVVGTAVASLAGTGALVAAGLAMAGHVALAAYADGSWGTVAFDAVGLATGLGSRGVNAIAVRHGVETTGMGAVEAVGVLRAPGASVARMGAEELTLGQLVSKTVSYQFDLAGGALGVVDLADRR